MKVYPKDIHQFQHAYVDLKVGHLIIKNLTRK
jgi:hypothetical protein